MNTGDYSRVVLGATAAEISPPRTPLHTIREHEDHPLTSSSPRLSPGYEHGLPRPSSRSSTGSARSLRRSTRSISTDFRVSPQDITPDLEKAYRDHYQGDDAHQSERGVVHDHVTDGRKAQREAGLVGQQQTDEEPDEEGLQHIQSSSRYDPVTDKGKRPVRSMDVYVS